MTRSFADLDELFEILWKVRGAIEVVSFRGRLRECKLMTLDQAVSIMCVGQVPHAANTDS